MTPEELTKANLSILWERMVKTFSPETLAFLEALKEARAAQGPSRPGGPPR